jgi:hypothetical protein
MRLCGRVWNDDIGIDERRILLREAYPRSSGTIIDMEAKLDWENLMPSTHEDLTSFDWSIILGRDVEP